MTASRDGIWQLDAEQYRAICAYLELRHASDELLDKVKDYLTRIGPQAPGVDRFERFIAERRMSAFELTFVDVWTRLWAPRNPWRYKLNAVLAVHECDARGFEDLGRTPDGHIATWLSIAGIGMRYVLSLAGALGWMTILYFVYLRQRREGG